MQYLADTLKEGQNIFNLYIHSSSRKQTYLGSFIYVDSCLSTYLVDQIMTKSGLWYMWSSKLWCMMFDIKIKGNCHTMMERWGRIIIFSWKNAVYNLFLWEVTKLWTRIDDLGIHLGLVSIYDVITVHQVPGYPNDDYYMTE